MIGKYKHILLAGLAALLVAVPVSIVVISHPAGAAVEQRACTDQEKKDGTGQESTTTQAGKTVTTCTTKDAAPGDTSAQKSSVDNSNSTCAIEKLGWVLCPVMETVGKIGDRAFGFLADNFLRTEPELVSNSNNGTRMAWGLARNLANIVFIIALLIIIYSQVTGAGVTNYGIKKMLPRLIVAAIAVNLSYFICQGMVDLSNIFGYEIKAFLVDTAKQVSDYAAMPPAGSIFGSSDSPGALQTIIGYALGVASLVWFLLPLMFMSAGSIVIICIVIVIILLLRKAFIVLLVVVSPIAFVLYLLPNTERYFRKWLSMLWQLLMVFPVVALLFGSGQLASAIILASGSGAQSSQEGKAYYSGKEAKCVQLPKYSTTDSSGKATGATSSGASIGTCGTSSTSVMLGLIAAGIAVAPLFAVVSVLKGALAAAGAMGGKISGAVESYGKKGGEGLQKRYQASTVGQLRARQKKIREGQIRSGAANELSWRRPISKSRAYLNRGLNDIPGEYGAQRDREQRKILSERAREKGEEFYGNQDYDRQFDTAIAQYNSATTKQARDEAMVNVNGAMIAASKSDDQAELTRMRNELRTARGQSGGTPVATSVATGQAQARAAAPTRTGIPSGTAGTGGGTPPTPRPTSANTSSRQAASAQGTFNPFAVHGEVSRGERSVSSLTNDELIGAGQVAGEYHDVMEDVGGDNANDATGQAIVDEMIKRGIDPTKHL